MTLNILPGPWLPLPLHIHLLPFPLIHYTPAIDLMLSLRFTKPNSRPQSLYICCFLYPKHYPSYSCMKDTHFIKSLFKCHHLLKIVLPIISIILSYFFTSFNTYSCCELIFLMKISLTSNRNLLRSKALSSYFATTFLILREILTHNRHSVIFCRINIVG